MSFPPPRLLSTAFRKSITRRSISATCWVLWQRRIRFKAETAEDGHKIKEHKIKEAFGYSFWGNGLLRPTFGLAARNPRGRLLIC